MKQNAKIENLAILGYYGSANTGDEAILDCFLQELSHNNPQFNITVFSSNTAHTQKHHNVHAVQSSLPNRWTDLVLRSIGRNRRNFYKTLSTFVKSDILLVGGGGLFHDTPDGNRHFLNMLHTISWAKRLGIRVAVLSVTVGPLYWKQSRKYLREVFSGVDLITVREEESKTLLDEIGLSHSDLYVTSDVVYLLRPAARERIHEIAMHERLDAALDERPRIAVCLCAYERNRPDRIRSVATFCDFAASRLGAQIWFIPMQTSPYHDDRDEAEAVLNRVQDPDSIRCLKGEYSPREILGLIGETHAVVAERLHGSIMAINANVPCFGIGYSPKVTWLFDRIGYPNHHIPLKELSPERLVADFSLFWESRDQVKLRLKTLSTQLRSSALENFSLFNNSLVADYVANTRYS